jgi:hypothetical protein
MNNITIGAGIAIGAGIGAALFAGTGQPVWIGVGVAIGAALGATSSRNAEDKGSEDGDG